MDRDIPLPDTPYWRAYQGRFQGILTWPAYDALAARLTAAPSDWYAFEMAAAPPEAPLDEAAFRALLAAAEEMYAPVRRNSLCGAVYVDDPEAPGFVKLFDPYNMGAVCGDSGQRTLPRWALSRIRPDALPVVEEPTPRKGLFSRLTG